MRHETKNAILVVSFGTSHEDTRKRTIEAIETEIAKAYPDYRIYRAWTSRMILAKLRKRDNLVIDNVTEAMMRMAADGITDVIVQPTHVINGMENDQMKQEVLAQANSFRSVSFGSPLLSSSEDTAAVLDSVRREFPSLGEDEALVFMGHGSTYCSNSAYAALNDTSQDMGYPNIFVGTVESCPDMDSLIQTVKARQPKKIILAPLMIVAGDHAKKDMAGEEPDSWISRFSSEGFDVEPVLKGLGEYAGIRRIFVRHIESAISSGRKHG